MLGPRCQYILPLWPRWVRKHISVTREIHGDVRSVRQPAGHSGARAHIPIAEPLPAPHCAALQGPDTTRAVATRPLLSTTTLRITSPPIPDALAAYRHHRLNLAAAPAAHLRLHRRATARMRPREPGLAKAPELPGRASAGLAVPVGRSSPRALGYPPAAEEPITTRPLHLSPRRFRLGLPQVARRRLHQIRNGRTQSVKRSGPSREKHQRRRGVSQNAFRATARCTLGAMALRAGSSPAPVLPGVVHGLLAAAAMRLVEYHCGTMSVCFGSGSERGATNLHGLRRRRPHCLGFRFVRFILFRGRNWRHARW
jgi:hypothetical protein